MKKRTDVWLSRLLALALAVLPLSGALAAGDPVLAYEGTVVGAKVVPVSVPYGGQVGPVNLRAGDWVKAGDTLTEIGTTLNFAPVEGTITGLAAAEGDSTESVTERYGAVLYIEPTHRYTIAATSEKAYNSSETHFLHLGERVYLTCASDGSHTGTGIISAFTENGWNVEVTGGEFYLEEKVDIFRTEDRAKESNLGRGTLNRAAPVAVKGSGSIVKLHVKNGDFVERGELLFETTEGVLDGLYAPAPQVLSPVTGVVSSVDKNEGDAIARNEALIKVIPAESFQVEFSMPEADLFTLDVGQKVSMELYWDDEVGRLYPGVISSIAYASEEQKEATDRKMYKAYVTFEPDERIRLGMTMMVYPILKAEETDEEETDGKSEETTDKTTDGKNEETADDTADGTAEEKTDGVTDEKTDGITEEKTETTGE